MPGRTQSKLNALLDPSHHDTQLVVIDSPGDDEGGHARTSKAQQGRKPSKPLLTQGNLTAEEQQLMAAQEPY